MSVDQWIARHASFTPDRPALADESLDLTYGALEYRVAHAAGALKGRGIDRGDRIAFLGYNSADMIVLLLAAARLGAIFVPLNWRLAEPEIAYAVENSGAKLLFHDNQFAKTAEVVSKGGGAEAVSVERDLPAMIGAAEPVTRPALAATEDAPLMIVYTSGTTGRPKGAVLGHRALEANAVMSVHMHAMTEADHVLTVLPMFHVGGLNIQTLPALFCGARATIRSRFHPGDFLEAVRELKPTLTVLVPATIKAALDQPGWDDADLTSLRAVASGSSNVPQGLIDAIEAKGVPVILVYGSTETAPICVYHRAETRHARKGGTGRAGLLAEMRIVDVEGHDVPPGVRGEILIRGPATLSGYWNDEAATAEAIDAEGWFRTGDIGEVDEQGDLAVLDRRKNMIISGGENIYPAELERVLHACPLIREAAVVARPDPRWQEVPVAVVVPADRAELDRETVLALFEGELARFKHPRDVVFVESLPRNAMGKIQHFQLRAALAGQASPDPQPATMKAALSGRERGEVH